MRFLPIESKVEARNGLDGEESEEEKDVSGESLAGETELNEKLEAQDGGGEGERAVAEVSNQVVGCQGYPVHKKEQRQKEYLTPTEKFLLMAISLKLHQPN